ncbi:transposase [Thorsellia kenyensis]|uniref:Transposase n=1 Tax=Thorsellia kenyensis TaxID=1549888 RepID=A0ABV6C6H0_9GAMM
MEAFETIKKSYFLLGKREESIYGIKSRVESIFGLGKMHLGMGQARYKGLKRNALSFSMRCLVLNLKRATTIKKELEQLQANYA